MRDFDVVLERCRERNLSHPPDGATRLFHGRGRWYPDYQDITVDRFADVLLVAAFGPDTGDVDTLGVLLADVLPDLRGVCVQRRRGRATRGEVVWGQVPEELTIEEAGLRFHVRPLDNQNVGLFLDMAPTRAWVRDQARDRRVLNLFAYTCAFSVAALAGGASRVVNVDMSRPSLDWGMRNHDANGQDTRQVSMVPHNLFKSWWKIRQLGPYDLLIVDPPTRQHGSFVAEKQYGQVLKRIPELATPGAAVVACLNSPFLNSDFLVSQMARWCPQCRPSGALPVSVDFPDRFPERGLKISLFRYGA